MKHAFLALLAVPLLGADEMRSFSKFRAPNVVGAYNDGFNPLGPTVEGFNFEIGFYLADGGESNPTRFWISRKNEEMIEVASISAVNRVISDIGAAENASVVEFIDIACRLLRVHIASYGPSGLPLDFRDRTPLEAVITRLRASGLDRATSDLLLSLGKLASRSVDAAGGTWKATWYEVDKLGGVERVHLSGSTSPFKVASVVREEVHGASTVRPVLLRRENFFDLSRG